MKKYRVILHFRDSTKRGFPVVEGVVSAASPGAMRQTMDLALNGEGHMLLTFDNGAVLSFWPRDVMVAFASPEEE